MNLVCACLAHDIDNPTGRIPVLGRQRRGQNLDVLDIVQDGADDTGASQRIIGDGAILKYAYSGVTQARHVAGPDAHTGALIGDSRRQAQYVRYVALEQREIVKILAFQRGARRRGLGFEQRRFGSDPHLLCYRAHLQHGVHRKRESRAQIQVLTYETLEPRSLNADAVRPRLQRWDTKYTFRVGDRVVAEVSVRVGDGDGRPTDHRSGNIGDPACYCRDTQLSVSRRSG